MQPQDVSLTGNPVAASQKGSEITGQAFSGEVTGKVETMVFSLNHQLAPKGQALSCGDCHVPDGRLDFVALGYSADKVSVLTSLYAEAAAEPAELPATGADLSVLQWLVTGAGGLLALGGGLLLKRRR